MKRVPLYSYDGSLVEWISVQRVERLDRLGRVRVLRHRKGHINRAVLHRLPGEPRPMRQTDYVGTRYSFQQHLADGHRCWRLRSLGDSNSEADLAPEEVRPIFLRVLSECLRAA